jgi:hypothetical protein
LLAGGPVPQSTSESQKEFLHVAPHFVSSCFRHISSSELHWSLPA